jgi:hypothetical protein
MIRSELINLAVKCHWRRGTLDYLERGLWCIYPGSGEPDVEQVEQVEQMEQMEQVVRLWDGGAGVPMKDMGSCVLSELKSINRPWIIGPFNGKFFSLKSMRIW